MNSVYIYHHLGLGDHIISNGLVRSIYEKYNRTFLFSKPKNFLNIKRMFKDLDNLKIIPFEDIQVRQFMEISPDNNYVIAGHDEFWKILKNPGNTLKIDEIFYKLAEVPIKNKWDKFYIERAPEIEKEVLKYHGIKDGDEFIFLHDDSERKIKKNIPAKKIIKPSMNFSLFDYMLLIEKAAEIHCINSAFFCLIDSSQIRDKKDKNLYLHEYARKDIGEESTPITYNNWNIIK